jgi:hypothetical protein
VQAELSVGLAVGGDPVLNVDAADGYITSLRLAFVVHRGIKSDFALFTGAGPVIFHSTSGETHVLGEVVAGARFRIFQTPNIALVAGLGAAALVGSGHFSVAVGARPLGSAGVVYYFR